MLDNEADEVDKADKPVVAPGDEDDTPKGNPADRDADGSIIDLASIDQSVPLTKVEEPHHRHHGDPRMSKEHAERIRRRHRRERFLIKLDLTLFIIVCLGGAATVIGLQMLQ